MPKFIRREEKSNIPSKGLSGGALLAVVPILAIFYVLMILPFLPADDGSLVKLSTSFLTEASGSKTSCSGRSRS